MSLTWGFVCNSGYSRQGKVGRDRGTRSEFEREVFEAEKAEKAANMRRRSGRVKETGYEEE